MQFRTEIESIKWPFSIDYESQLAFIGSCFSNEISSRCRDLGFSTLANPFGTVYNPASINKQLQLISGEAANLLEYASTYYCLDTNTEFTAGTKEALTTTINATSKKALEYLKSANVIFITLGTAHAFVEKESAQKVANCHKLPATLFNRKLLLQDELIDSIHSINQTIRAINANVRICYTISPVRHLSNGLVENSISKAALRTALHTVMDGDDAIHYFPAYEIVLDDLRDYRFYTEDLSHINQQGVNYVWEKFSSVFTETCQQQIKQVIKYNQLRGHKPRQLEAHQELLQGKRAELLKNIKGITL